MAQAIVIEQYGGPDVLQAQQVEVGAPAAGELRLRQTFLGVNFHDVYVRSGQYNTLALPGTPGIEGVGIVDAVGDGVDAFRPGDRIGYVTSRYGCYASERLLSADLALKLPDHLDDRSAAAMLLKGLTAEMLLHHVHKVKNGDWVLVQAAAGGVGKLLVQWASKLGARVIGTAGSAAKAEAARAAGCTEVILYRDEDVAARVAQITGGRGVDVAYDAVGADSFAGSLASLAPCSHLVNFGQASGPVPPVAMSMLAARSTTLSRPVVFHYVAGRARLEQMAASLFDAFDRGWIAPEAPIEFPLHDAAAAHALLESRAAAQPIVLRT
ncbi:quinone oxidoreductase family protein [Piscinibacter sakaiensis]|uniref:quinone oxidoreductase family protein n=1 Tax=Piscinibacter sakaiensis TaxID=1547922 RepID=UPI003AACD1C8